MNSPALENATPSRDRVEAYVTAAMAGGHDWDELRIRLTQLFNNAMVEAYLLGYDRCTEHQDDSGPR